MTPCNRLVFDGGVPVRTDKINLTEILLQVETLASSLNLQYDDLVVFLLVQETESSGLTNPAIKSTNVLNPTFSQSRDKSINLSSKMTEDQLAISISFPSKNSRNHRIHFAAAKQGTRSGVLFGDDFIGNHSFDIVLQERRKNASLSSVHKQFQLDRTHSQGAMDIVRQLSLDFVFPKNRFIVKIQVGERNANLFLASFQDKVGYQMLQVVSIGVIRSGHFQ